MALETITIEDEVQNQILEQVCEAKGITSETFKQCFPIYNELYQKEMQVSNQKLTVIIAKPEAEIKQISKSKAVEIFMDDIAARKKACSTIRRLRDQDL